MLFNKFVYQINTFFLCGKLNCNICPLGLFLDFFFFGCSFLTQDDRKGKEHLDSWFSDKLQPFNMYSHQPEIVKVRKI